MVEAAGTMMMVKTRAEDFFGLAVTVHEANDESLWVTADQAAPILGLKGRNSVAKLYRDHKDEFLTGVDCAYVKLGVSYCEDESSPQRDARKKTVLCFSLNGLELLALLVRNEVGRRARRWTVDLRAKVRSGEVKLASSARVTELESFVQTLLTTINTLVATVSQMKGAIEEQARTQFASTQLSKKLVSHAGAILACHRLNPTPEEERRRATATELKARRNGHGFLIPPPEGYGFNGRRLNGTDLSETN